MLHPADYPQLAEDAFNRRDAAALGALWAPGLRYDAPGEASTTRDAAIARERALWKAFPDIRAALRPEMADEERLVLHGVLTGTHEGPLRLGSDAIAATGRKVRVEFLATFCFADGFATGERVYFDRLELLQQLGLLPA